MLVIGLLLSAASVSSAFAQRADPGSQPCAYFPETLVREAFSPLASAPLKQSQRRTCSYEITGRTTNESVSINFQTNRITPKTIDALFNRMKNGSKTEVRGQVVETKPMDVEWVSGVGEKAFWNNNLQQLAVTAKNTLFYITMPLSGMSKQQKIEAGRKVAAGVIARL
ncbi:MAG: hypothetical protein KJZ84_19740 [Bryobacteraceae bacterium]|nr:hypothetical protein [Bryobacteraceae bacterium]